MEKEFFLQWLKSHKYCVLATAQADRPWAATMDYTVDDSLNIYIGTSPASLKFQNIKRNPIVGLVIDSQDESGTLQLQGTAQERQPTNDNPANLVIRPTFLIFKKKDEKTDEVEVKELKM